MSFALLDAVRSGDYVRVRELLAKGANTLFEDGAGENALHRLYDGPGHVEMFDDLVAAGCDVTRLNGDGRSLFKRAGSQDPGICRRLIDAGLDVNQADPRGLSSLHFAARNPQAVEMLIRAGAKVNARTIGGVTPLYRAAAGASLESCRLLVRHGADVMAVDNDGETVLHAAAGKGTNQLLEFLIDKGAEVNALDKNLESPLHAAAKAGNTGACRVLVDAGASSSFVPPNPPKGHLTPF